MARSAEIGTTPVPVGAAGRAFVVVRLRPGGEISAFPPAARTGWSRWRPPR
ncbi:hypothetical protein [Blastococcus brunescens]|uniref:Uncharacterized protein n=1 Tax=Blastococcus brunescens TaxID=1564165 RepID=A0ABZ1B2U0_9ACTN|nr:hypothetical protein [Blastococcus sp. BMG 8361]WRL64036.1 hypothetical protein U6N30_31365 [Blastococcus sp. BMG 8361]